MNAATKVAAFGLVLAVVFGLALLVGDRVGPFGVAAGAHPASADGHRDHSADPGSDPGADPGSDNGSDPGAGAEDSAGGLMVSDRGYTLALAEPVQSAGAARPLTFIIESSGGPVRSFEKQHEEALHLIAVRRDFGGYQHVHPTLGADGVWSTALDLTPGQWRVFTDFKPRGAEPLTLGADLRVPGSPPDARPAAARAAEVGDYTVTLAGELVPGERSPLTLEVSRQGRPVTDLQPYLGTFGHLVALRSGDLAYLHVHPESASDLDSTDTTEGEHEHGHGATAGPEVDFLASVPSGGTYHLYFDFRHGDVVRTAHFSLEAERD